MKHSLNLGYKWDLLNILLLFLITSFSLSKPVIKFVSDSVENISETNGLDSKSLNTLFANNSSLGVLAICAAEGNCTIDGKKTSLYYSHVDPGNSVELYIPHIKTTTTTTTKVIDSHPITLFNFITYYLNNINNEATKR
ncbi:MAG: hypothetical protein WA959_27825, partial [Rivularia sp. (in: cyanobacteria)]